MYLGVGVKERALVQVEHTALTQCRHCSNCTALVQSLGHNLETNPRLRVSVLLDYCRGRCWTCVNTAHCTLITAH